MNDDNIQKKLDAALTECAMLRKENIRLQKLLGQAGAEPEKASDINASTITTNSPPDVKIALFLSLFRGRKDVYPVRWEGKNGRAGYSPACSNEWSRAFCNKPRVKCGDCNHRKFLPVTNEVILDHLTGKHTIGVYPLLHDETCRFLAVDFDKSGWQDDAAAFLEVCKEMDIPATLERSRSGNGGHVWIFFQSPVSAATARKLGSAILTRCMDKRYQVGFDSYDRFFPSQDTMPVGGFGNLIALPLQHYPRENGNTLFLDGNFKPHPDQWEFLSSIKRMALPDIDRIVRNAENSGKVMGDGMNIVGENEENDPWTLPPSGMKQDIALNGPFPETVRVVLGDLIYVEKEGLKSDMLNRMMRLAAFQNPEFYKAQAMRLPTYDKPRIISCSDDFQKHLGLPRGCLGSLSELLTDLGIKQEVSDERYAGIPIDLTFQGELHSAQKDALCELLTHDVGILAATTAFGKTVVAAALIAKRKVNTLIIVHRRQLMDQWSERIATFLDLPSAEIGRVGGGKEKLTGKIDIGMIQSLNRKGVVKDLVAQYGQVIVDECHHISAFSFEEVMKKVKAKFVMGLTATPIRKDGHHPIIMMQCGPIRYRVGGREQAQLRPFDHTVLPRYTDFVFATESPIFLNKDNLGIQETYAALTANEKRNALIVSDVINAIKGGRSPILLTERTDHVDILAASLSGSVRNIVVMKGGMGVKQRKDMAAQLADIPDEEERLIIATGRYIGEGFDDARLDTLFLALPISWRGTLQQYAGRLHRLHGNKKEVRIYDYVDNNVPMLMRMYKRRIEGYGAMGYVIKIE